jgi:hypothetical protein
MAQIQKREIHIPEILNAEVSEVLDYPPKLFISMQQPAAPGFTSPEIQIGGLDVECCFSLVPEVVVMQHLKSKCK